MNKVRIIGSLLGIGGFVTLGITVGWLPALGVFLCIWGNNLHGNGYMP